MPERRIAAAAAASAVLLCASQAQADCAITITPASNNLGKIVANTTRNAVADSAVATTFTIPSTGGVVTQNPPAASAGAATLLSPPSNLRWRVTVDAGPSCSGTNLPMRFTASSAKFQFPATTFTISGPSGGTVSTPTLANGAQFLISFSQNGSKATMAFDLGMSVTLPANRTAGPASWTILATVQ